MTLLDKLSDTRAVARRPRAVSVAFADSPPLDRSAGWTRHAAAAAAAVGLALLYALGAWLSIHYQSPRIGATAFWPSAGLTLATLVLTPRRTWPLWLVAFGAAEFSVDVAHHQAVALALAYALANTAEPLVGTLLLCRYAHSPAATRAHLAAFVACAVVAGPIVGASIGATAAVVFGAAGQGWWETAWVIWLGDALGVLVVGSLVVVWARRPRSHYRAPLPAIFAMAAVGAGAIVLTAVEWQAPVVLAALPVLIWAAFAGSSLAVATVGAAVAVATDWAALTGRTRGLLAGASPPHDVMVLQCYLGLALITAMALNSEVADRRRDEDRARQAEQAAIKVAEAERHSISQDTHDIVGHGLTAVLLQLGAARQLLERDPHQARELLASAEVIGRAACEDLELALTSLSHDDPTRPPGSGLASLPELAEALTRAGLPVVLDIGEGTRRLPTLVDWSAYRIAREALTNVVRHAPGSTATVTARVRGRVVVLSVVDDGGPARCTALSNEGRGIVGMRERAAALGGTLDACPRPCGGFAVVAKLPW